MPKNLCKRVVILGLDGAGNAVKDADAPNIKELFAEGACTWEARTEFPSISAECWGSLFHGVHFAGHGIDHEIIDKRPCPEDLPCPSFMKACRRQTPDAKLASLVNWEPINFGIIEDSCGCLKRSAPDDELTPQIADYILNNDFTILFVQFDDIDHVGHADGYWTEPFYRQVRKTDANVGKILGAIGEKGIAEETLVIACADHGGGGFAGAFTHGSDSPRDMTIFWGCRGPGVRRGAALKGVQIADTAAVVARALGLTPPAGWTGKVPDGLFLPG
jgi:hypothetical protein